MKTMQNQSLQGKEPPIRLDSTKVQSFFRSLRDSPETVILTMRFVGFGITCLLIILLSLSGKLSFDAIPPLGVFVPYIFGTTLLMLYAKQKQTQSSLFLLLLLDIFAVSFVLYTIQISGNPPVALNSLYLIILIAASLLERRLIVFLGLATLFGYLGTTWMNSSDVNMIFNSEHVTQVAMFMLFTALAASQSYYFAYISRKRDEEALLLRDQFVFTTAHDLRAPFALIRLLAEKYESRQPKTLSQLKEDMETINTNVSMASKLLEDLLRLAKGEHVKIDAHIIDIVPQIKQLIKHWEFAIQKKKILVEYKESRIIEALVDGQKLGYILDNLIGNGVKYNKQGGTLRIWHEIKKGQILTMFENTGPGIDQENFSLVFTPYFRELKDPSVPGTGLGLYSAKKFIELMKGSISVTSTKTTTRFTISLPTKS